MNNTCRFCEHYDGKHCFLWSLTLPPDDWCLCFSRSVDYADPEDALAHVEREVREDDLIDLTAFDDGF